MSPFFWTLKRQISLGAGAFFLIFFSTFTAEAFHVVIDPGHGGTDRGAIRGNIQEAQVVLNVAKELETLLEQQEGIQISLTRSEDVNLSLQERLDRAKNAGGDLFVSLHANSAPVSKASGVELFFQNTLPPDEDLMYLANLENQSEINKGAKTHKSDLDFVIEDLRRQGRQRASLEFAEMIKESFPSENHRNVSIKQAPFYVVSKASMPSVLVELGFVTNPTEAKKLTSPRYQKELAKKMMAAILQYREQVRGLSEKTGLR